MNSLESHPEDLLELERRGSLSDADLERLDAHLRECAACAAEVWARTVSAHDRQSLRGDFALDRKAVDAAITTLAAKTLLRPIRRPAWMWALAAAIPLSAMAAIEWQREWRHAHSPIAVLSSASPIAGEIPPAVTVTEPPALQSSEALENRPPNSSESSEGPAAHGPHAQVEPGPATLFRRASALERNGETDRAIDVYRTLQQRFANSGEAKASYAVAGQLLLEERSYRMALRQFDRYLMTVGAAREEALVGRAAALQGLGEKRDESDAWQALLHEFPGSVYGSRAHHRLTELGVEAAPPNQL